MLRKAFQRKLVKHSTGAPAVLINDQPIAILLVVDAARELNF
jgi:hypothetical protein